MIYLQNVMFQFAMLNNQRVMLQVYIILSVYIYVYIYITIYIYIYTYDHMCSYNLLYPIQSH